MESKDKTTLNCSKQCLLNIIAVAVVIQVILFSCVVFIIVPYQINNEIYSEQSKLRSEIMDIKKSLEDIKKTEGINKPVTEHLLSRAKRYLQVHGSGPIRKVLVKMLEKLNSLESKINRSSTFTFVPFLRGPQGPTGKKGDPGSKGKSGRKGRPGKIGPEGEQGSHIDHFINISGSTTFIRWGKTTCPNTSGITKIYSGRIAGQHYTHAGGTSSNLCLHINPKFGKPDVGNTLQYIYGTEYETSHGNPFNKNLHDLDAVCVVCRVESRGSKVIINGRNDCPDSWTLEYSGYLMSAHYNHKGRNTAICVDVDADGAVGSKQNLDGNLLYTLQGSCGALPCAPYVEGRELTCAVCTK